MSEGEDAPDLQAMVRALARANRQLAASQQELLESNRQLTDLIEAIVGTSDPPRHYSELQAEILAALNGVALRSQPLADAIHRDKRRLYDDPGGLPQLQEWGRVKLSERHGYFRPDAKPPNFVE